MITVDTAVAHLAGAMGKLVWVMLPFAPDWRWMLDRDDPPWYPIMRLFRQSQPGDWVKVLRSIQTALFALSNQTDHPHQLSQGAQPMFTAFNRQKACRHGQMVYNMNDRYIGRSLDLYGEFSEGEIDLFCQIGLQNVLASPGVL